LLHLTSRDARRERPVTPWVVTAAIWVAISAWLDFGAGQALVGVGVALLMGWRDDRRARG
jgi:hypothetical protein